MAVQMVPDDEGSACESESSGGVVLDLPKSGNIVTPTLKINNEFAKRYEHNKKRAELHRLEERYGKTERNGRARSIGHDERRLSNDGSYSSPSSEEDEDEEGELAAGPLDEQFQATLRALKSKDPRVYDKQSQFYIVDEEEVDSSDKTTVKEKPMYLSDYHRENLLRAHVRPGEESRPFHSYEQEQWALKYEVMKEVHAAADAKSEIDDDESDGMFLIKKADTVSSLKRVRKQAMITAEEVASADKDPDTFLSNFLATRAWVPTTGGVLQPFESDDEEEDQNAEDFEAAYNLRFESPTTTNEKLTAHARDVAAKYSARQEPRNPRQRAREVKKAQLIGERQDRERGKARLKKLKIDEAEGKLKRVKKAAGLRGEAPAVDEWFQFLTEDWDDRQWEIEMKHRFGEDYYAAQDRELSDSDIENSKNKASKKPKWSDDIDITDLVPEFADDDADADFSLSNGDADPEAPTFTNKRKSVTERDESKRKARRERRQLEMLVDGQIKVDMALDNASKKNLARFRYRETSPIAWGLTPEDILMASDSQLNQFVGLKKLAAFREPDKKRRDKKNIGKKARLRQWRKDTFGNEFGPSKSLQDLLGESLRGEVGGEGHSDATGVNKVDARDGKKRSRLKGETKLPTHKL